MPDRWVIRVDGYSSPRYAVSRKYADGSHRHWGLTRHLQTAHVFDARVRAQAVADHVQADVIGQHTRQQHKTVTLKQVLVREV